MTEPVTSKPYGGYIISDDSYLARNKYGQVDIYCNVTLPPGISQPHMYTVAFVGGDYQPDNYRSLICFAVDTTTLVTMHRLCFVYFDGTIRVDYNGLNTNGHVFYITGSYFI